MVKRLLFITLIIVPVVFGLAACDLFVAFLTMSPFPGYLSQAVASVDLKSEIEKFLGDDYVHWESNVYVLRNSVSEHVFLVVRKDPGGQTVYVFDTTLKLELTHEVDSQRRIHLVEDFNENFVVGDVQFDKDTLSPDSPYPPIADDTWDKYTFAHMGSNYLTWSSYDELWCTEYDSGWSLLSSDSTFIETGEDRRLLGLGYEPVLADPVLGVGATPVYLFAHGWEWDGNRDDGFLYIIRTDANDFPNPTVAINLVTDGLANGRTSPRIRNVGDNRPVFYTRKGVVAETRTRGTFQLLKLNGQRIKSFYITSDEDTSLYFDIDGEYYYIFDDQNFRLYKAKTGF